jgi:radical SAM protein with 4Fe4S-binding SPASM domain
MDFLERASALKRDHAPDLTLTARTIVPHWPDRAKWRALLAPLGWQSHFYHYHRLPDSADNMTGRPLEVPEGTCFFVETFNQLYVQIDGTVVPCCAHPQAGVYGNLQEQTFSEIYHGTARQAFKAELVANRRSMSICGGCEFDAAVKNDPTRIAFQPDVAFREGLIPLARKGRDGEPKLVVTRHKGGV